MVCGRSIISVPSVPKRWILALIPQFFDGEFPLAKLISGLLGGEEPEEKDGKFQQVVCPTCGMTYEKFVENSCFGCADCYSVFDLLIRDNIKQLQGSDCHKGKHPKIRPAGEVHQTEDTVAVDVQAQKVLHRDEEDGGDPQPGEKIKDSGGQRGL